MAEAEKSTRAMPKGGRKGGARFPRIALDQALKYSSKLVAKTHTGSQAASTILPGVFGSAGPRGEVRASALKQYGLMIGEKDGYEASRLAKDIEAATPEEKGRSIQEAFLFPKIFKDVFDTFHGDTVSKAKIRQRVLHLEVHPDLADECVEFFISSAITADLATTDGESVKLKAAQDVGTTRPDEVLPGTDDTDSPDSVDESENVEGAEPEEPPPTPADLSARKNPAVTVSLAVDSSLDTDKLRKQLELLRKYGVI